VSSEYSLDTLKGTIEFFLNPQGVSKKGIQMATSSIHIDSGANGYFAHNSRESKTVNAIFDDEKNYCSCTNAEAFDLFKKELAIRSEAYQKRTGQKLQSKTVTHLSAIVNFNKEHTPENIKKLCDFLEKELDTKVIQFAMHRDEGHIAENGEKIKNYHAHIEFMGLDSQGNSIKRTLKKKELINLQSKTAEILGMQRGRNYVAEKAKRPKRLDTYEFKKAKEMESKAKESNLLKTTYNQLLATKQDLAAAQNEVREYLKEIGATRKEFAELDQLNKDLKEQLKAKDLTIEEMQDKFNSLKHSLENDFNKLHNEKEHYKSVVELKEVEIMDLEPYKNLYFSQEHDLNSLQEQNRVLADKVTTLQEKINSSPNMEQYEHIKQQHEIRNKMIQEEAKQIQELEPEKTNLRKLVDYFKNTINDLKTKVNSLFKRNQELEAENKALKDEIYELKRDRIIESGKDNPHEAIRKTLEHAGLGSRTSASILAELKEQRRQQREEDSPFNVSGSMIKFKENQKKDLNEIIENNRKKEEKERLEQEQQRQRQRDSLTR